MKKYVLGAIVPVVIFLGVVAFRNFQSFGKRAKTSEVKLIARELSESFVKNGSLESSFAAHYYKWSAGEDVRKFCADCGIESKSFKVLIFGNIDTDPELDMWTYEYPSEQFVILSNDVTN